VKLPSGRTTNSIAAINVAIFLLLSFSGRIEDAAILGGFIPARWGAPGLLDGMAAVPFWLTPVSSAFIHAGWLHIGFNMLMLLFCGRQIEHVLGWSGTLILYAVGAYAACLAQWIADPLSSNPMVGASGAISAVVATYSLLYSQQQVRRIGPLSSNIVRMLWLAAAWIVMQLMIGYASGSELAEIGQIAVAAHIGGFIAGLVLTRPLLRWRFRKRPQVIN
jgi:membrane associated rhomboid family serine protease